MWSFETVRGSDAEQQQLFTLYSLFLSLQEQNERTSDRLLSRHVEPVCRKILRGWRRGGGQRGGGGGMSSI